MCKLRASRWAMMHIYTATFVVGMGTSGSKHSVRPYHFESFEDPSSPLGAMMSFVCPRVNMDCRAVWRACVEETSCEAYTTKLKFVDPFWLHVSG